MKNIAIFGSTGSIGTSTIKVLKLHPDEYRVFALTGHRNINLLFKQCMELKPKYVYINNDKLAKELARQLREANSKAEVLCEPNDLIFLASHPEVNIVMSAIVGSAGLLPTYHAALSGKKVLLANKESLVAGGAIIMKAAKENGATIIPIDSEHSAIFQSLPFGYENLQSSGVNKIILTASGGPFLNTSYEMLQKVDARAAVKHPNWDMGHKISVDSATLMNKGLEVIEAYWLFNATIDQIEVVIHPQSIIHSMVEYIDGSILAQLGTPDMKTPIAYGLSAPKRITSGSKKLNFMELGALTFAKPDLTRFPCLQLALAGLKDGECACAIINASNETAVAKFLNDEHGFYSIPAMIEKALGKFSGTKITTIDELIELDLSVKSFCNSIT